jgi:nucleoid DNA-binding protein
MKPASMSMKEWLIKKMAIKLVISEKTIEAVINHQFDSASEATKTNNSVEISGFGKFVFNVKRAHKQMLKYESQKAMYEAALLDIDITDAVRRNTTMRLETVIGNIVALSPKLNNNEPI